MITGTYPTNPEQVALRADLATMVERVAALEAAWGAVLAALEAELADTRNAGSPNLRLGLRVAHRIVREHASEAAGG